jgi:hypothetical protein
VKCSRKLLGAYRPISRNRIAPPPNSTAVLPGDIGPLGSPWPFFGATTTGAGLAAAPAGGAADSLGGGGGHVTSPL